MQRLNLFCMNKILESKEVANLRMSYSDDDRTIVSGIRTWYSSFFKIIARNNMCAAKNRPTSTLQYVLSMGKKTAEPTNFSYKC